MNCVLLFCDQTTEGVHVIRINMITSSETPIIEMKLHKLTKC